MSNNLHVSYDLREPGKNYEAVIAKIKSLGGWAKIHYSFWYLKTPRSCEEVAKAIWGAMDSSDSLYVVDPTNKTAFWYNIPKDTEKYIQENWSK